MSAYDRGSTCQCQHMSNFMPAASRAHFILPFLEYTPEYTHLTPEHPPHGCGCGSGYPKLNPHPHPQGSHTQHPHGLPTPTLFPRHKPLINTPAINGPSYRSWSPTLPVMVDLYHLGRTRKATLYSVQNCWCTMALLTLNSFQS